MENHCIDTLFETIRDVYLKKSTGELTLTFEKGKRFVYIINGNIKYARSEFEDERIGQFLIKENLLKEEDLDDVLAKARESKMILGEYLKERGFAKGKDIKKTVEKMIRFIVSRPFFECLTDIRFMRQQQFIDDNILLDISTAGVLLDGVRVVENDAFFNDFYEENISLSPDLMKNATHLYQELQLTPQEGYLMSRIDGSTSLEEIARMSGMPKEKVAKMLYALHLVGIISFKETPENDDVEVMELEDDEPDDKYMEGVMDADDVIDLDDEPSAKPKTPAASAAKVKLRDEDFVEEVLDYSMRMDVVNLYQVLNLKNMASIDEVKLTYNRLIKRYHPDKHSSKMYFDIISKLELIINKITEAYQVLSNPEKKEKYDQELIKQDEIKRKTVKVEQKDQIYNDAMVLLKAGNIFNALSMFQRGLQVAPEDKRFHFELGKLFAKKKETHGKAERHLKTALQLDPSYADCYLFLARIYKEADNAEQALRYYSDVLAFDPENKEADLFINGGGKKDVMSAFKGMFGKKK